MSRRATSDRPDIRPRQRLTHEEHEDSSLNTETRFLTLVMPRLLRRLFYLFAGNSPRLHSVANGRHWEYNARGRSGASSVDRVDRACASV